MCFSQLFQFCIRFYCIIQTEIVQQMQYKYDWHFSARGIAFISFLECSIDASYNTQPYMPFPISHLFPFLFFECTLKLKWSANNFCDSYLNARSLHCVARKGGWNRQGRVCVPGRMSVEHGNRISSVIFWKFSCANFWVRMSDFECTKQTKTWIE